MTKWWKINTKINQNRKKIIFSNIILHFFYRTNQLIDDKTNNLVFSLFYVGSRAGSVSNEIDPQHCFQESDEKIVVTKAQKTIDQFFKSPKGKSSTEEQMDEDFPVSSFFLYFIFLAGGGTLLSM